MPASTFSVEELFICESSFYQDTIVFVFYIEQDIIRSDEPWKYIQYILVIVDFFCERQEFNFNSFFFSNTDVSVVQFINSYIEDIIGIYINPISVRSHDS